MKVNAGYFGSEEIFCGLKCSHNHKDEGSIACGCFFLSLFGALQFKNQWVWIMLSEATFAHSCLQLHLKLSLSIPKSSKDFLVSILDK